jgi:hypothetical protein
MLKKRNVIYNRHMIRKILIIALVSIICVGAGYLVAGELNGPESAVPVQNQATLQSAVSSGVSAPAAQKTSISVSAAITQKIEQKVPFVVQAPFGNWSNPLFQNACEEASVVMAMGWIAGTVTIPAQDAQSQILKIVDFENKTFGYDADTDIYDIQRIFREDFHYKNIAARENITRSDIKDELQKGNIVLVPAFGQALDNPSYTAPGPIVHMLVIIGYDPTTKEFITNDSGTKHGSGYRYDENVLFGAIWEYPSGVNPPQAPTGTMEKGMLIVQPR